MTQVRKELEAGVFIFNDDDEDIHMAIERRLTEMSATPARNCTLPARATTRSRPTSRSTRGAARNRRRPSSRNSCSALHKQAGEHRTRPMPGYTHLQRAQSVYLAHHLLAYFWMFQRDRTRFTQVVGIRERAAARRRRDRRHQLRHRPRAWSPTKLGFKSVAPELDGRRRQP